MDFIDACKVVLRRWYVAVPLLLLTFAGTSLAYTSASANYTAKASLVLISPPSRVTADGETAAVCPTNPWCAGSDVLNLANVTARELEDPRLAGELLDPHPGATYEVVLNAENRSTIMELTSTARTPEDAIDTLDELIGQVDATLTGRQAKPIGESEPPETVDYVTTDVLTKSEQAAPQSGGKLRAAAAAFGLGIAIALGGTFLAESLAVSRRQKETLLDRIALPDQPANGAKPERTPSPEPQPVTAEGASQAAASKAGGAREAGSKEAASKEAGPKEAGPKEAGPLRESAGSRRSGRIGSS